MAKQEYKLASNEGIILKQERVMSEGFMASFTDELILTNLNLVLISKGVYGNVKNIRIFPLNQLKVTNNKVQVFLSKSQTLQNMVEFYFVNGQQKFTFESRKDANNLINQLNMLLIGDNAEILSQDKAHIPGSEVIAEYLGGTLDVFKGALGFKQKKHDETQSIKTSKKCSFCGAMISGKVGMVVRCSYCDADQQV